MQDLNQLQAYLCQFAKYPAGLVKGSSKKYNQYDFFNLSRFNSPRFQHGEKETNHSSIKHSITPPL
jgi:hypothetical protein